MKYLIINFYEGPPKCFLKFYFNIGDWGLGIGDWGLGPIPNPQSPIPNPQIPNPHEINYNCLHLKDY